MVRILKTLVMVAVLGLLGLSVYAYLGNMDPVRQDIRQPVEIDVSD